MGWFISIMTPFCVTRQFHCPEVFFFSLSSSSPGWRLFSKGGGADGMAWDQTGGRGEEALVNTHEQSLSLAVSAEGATMKRGGIKQSHFPTGEKDTGLEFIFLFWRGYSRGAELQNTLPFDFQPRLWSCHTNLPCGCISVSPRAFWCAHSIKTSNNFASFCAIGKTSFSL